MRVSSLSQPEYAVLLDAAVPLATPRANLADGDEARWRRIVQLADWHRLSPLLYTNVHSQAEAPGWVRQTLERDYFANTARNLFVRDAQRRVLGALAEAEVPAMLLKGAALLETVYPDPAVRELLDLDILVPDERMSTATAALARLGYLSSGEDAAPEHHAAALIGDEEVVAVELHRHIAITGEARDFAIDDLWLRARASAHGPHLLPSPEDLLLHVCLHFTRNRLGGSHRHRNTGGALAQVADIARISEHERVDWEALAAHARRYRMDAAVFLALFAASDLGAPVPAVALAALRPPRFEPELGRRLVELRVLADDTHLPVRSARWMLLPSREVLRHGWAAESAAPLTLARAYVRRAQANAPMVGAALRRPWTMVQDRRLGDEIRALQERA